ncbi:hypothetical protein CJ199_02670 [Brevibacterium paucivorans]|uniref:Uncharacterized protein n=1 Tax=Brevibacterium paucivorans TaxID=170994 RepID=A0A2N6VQK8_9MICO|nr:hypothetical protein CJ199_02670 [Brevibacterium paucivorans]
MRYNNPNLAVVNAVTEQHMSVIQAVEYFNRLQQWVTSAFSPCGLGYITRSASLGLFCQAHLSHHAGAASPSAQNRLPNTLRKGW